jgi:formate dehydrogenase major subunit
LLGNMGRPGGGMNAERGHANIQGNTDHAISWDILPGYLKVPAPGQGTVADYVELSASKQLRPTAINYFGTNYRNFMVSLLKAWYGDAATKQNEFAFDYLPKPAGNASWLSIFDQALQGKMEGVMLSGMTATSIGPDSNQVLQALSNLKWLCVMDAYPTTSSEFWRAPGIDPAKVQTEVFMLPATHWIEKDGRLPTAGRWAQWRAIAAAEGNAMHPLDRHELTRSGQAAPVAGRGLQDPIMALTPP